MSVKDITIVIASFKSEKKIRNCLNSIDKKYTVINVENSANQDYKRKIEEEFKNVYCILTGENFGYGKANNIGLNKVKTKYALILNPDTELFPDTLDRFIKLANEKNDFSIIGPGIVETKKNLISDEKVRAVNAVKGYAMFLNLSEFKDIGFFDENFFFFLEEIDLCKRLTKKNKKIYLSPNIKVYHEGGKSHDDSFNYQMELSRNWHWMWSTFYYNKKYRGFINSFFVVLPKLFSAIIKVIIYFLILNKVKRKIYFQRLSGLINAILGKNSWYRPKV